MEREHLFMHQADACAHICSVGRYRRPGLDPDTALYAVLGLNGFGWLLWQNNPGFMAAHAVVSDSALRQVSSEVAASRWH